MMIDLAFYCVHTFLVLVHFRRPAAPAGFAVAQLVLVRWLNATSLSQYGYHRFHSNGVALLTPKDKRRG